MEKKPIWNDCSVVKKAVQNKHYKSIDWCVIAINI